MGDSNAVKRVAIYARISEANDRLGVIRQVQLGRARAEAEGWDVVGPFIDNDKSAYTGSKPRSGYEALLETVASGAADEVWCAEFERWTRWDRELLRFHDALRDAGVAWARHGSVEAPSDIRIGTAAGDRAFRDRGSAAIYESALKSERVSRKVAELKEGGFWTGGGRPFGFDLVPAEGGKRLRVRADEAAALRGAYEALLNGRSLRGAARDLDAAGYRTTRGNAFNANSLRQTLRAERNRGAVVDGSTFRAVAAILDDPKRKPTGRGEKYPLTGLVVCAVDGGALSGSRVGKRRASGERARKYVCAHTGRVHLGIDAEALETYVVGEASARSYAPVELRDPAEVDPALAAEEERLERELEELGESDLPLPTIRGRARRLAGELEALRARIEEAAAPREKRYWGDYAEEIWGFETLDPRTLVEHRVERVVVSPVGRGGTAWRTPVAERVRIVYRRGVTKRAAA